MAEKQALLVTGEKVEVLVAKGPKTATVNVGPGAAANLDLDISIAKIQQILDHLAATQISGVPDGLALANVSFPVTGSMRLRVFNPTTATVSVGIDAVTSELLAMAL